MPGTPPDRLYANRTRAESFGDLAELYDRARPRYPAVLFDRILSAGAPEVLDVGTGTGIAAAQMAQRGARVLGVEADARMAAVARAKGLPVEVARFEAWDPAGRRFDLITSGQAWHWIEPAAGLGKVASLLRPGGRVAVFWNFGEPPPEVRRRLRTVYERLTPELAQAAAGLDEDTQRERNRRAVAAFGESGLFEGVEVERFPWRGRYDTDGWVAFLATHSDHHTLPAERREPLLEALAGAIDELGGSFEVDYRTVLITATPVAAG